MTTQYILRTQQPQALDVPDSEGWWACDLEDGRKMAGKTEKYPDTDEMVYYSSSYATFINGMPPAKWYRLTMPWEQQDIHATVHPPHSVELRDLLAEYAHEAWSGWMKYLFSKGYFRNIEVEGVVQAAWVMPQYCRIRWQRQMNTPYAELPEDEKKSDREEADRMLAIMNRVTPHSVDESLRSIVPQGVEVEAQPLPCPFCGETPNIENDNTFLLEYGGKWGAIMCCCTGPQVRTGYQSVEEWKDDAIAAWNQRAMPPGVEVQRVWQVTPERVEALDTMIGWARNYEMLIGKCTEDEERKVGIVQAMLDEVGES